MFHSFLVCPRSVYVSLSFSLSSFSVCLLLSPLFFPSLLPPLLSEGVTWPAVVAVWTVFHRSVAWLTTFTRKASSDEAQNSVFSSSWTSSGTPPSLPHTRKQNESFQVNVCGRTITKQLEHNRNIGPAAEFPHQTAPKAQLARPWLSITPVIIVIIIVSIVQEFVLSQRFGWVKSTVWCCVCVWAQQLFDNDTGGLKMQATAQCAVGGQQQNNPFDFTLCAIVTVASDSEPFVLGGYRFGKQIDWLVGWLVGGTGFVIVLYGASLKAMQCI